MNTAKQILMVTLCASLLAMTATGQETSVGISPVYIPGTKSGIKNSIKTIDQTRSSSTTKTVSNHRHNNTGNFGNSNSGSNDSNSNYLNNSGKGCGGPGCDAGTGCGCGNRCGCNGGCDSGCSSGCSCGNGSCGCNDRVGGSFFGRLRDLSPVRFNINQGHRGGCGNGCAEGDCRCDCRTLDGLSQILPVTVRICSNHCSRYFGVFGGYYDLEDFDGVAGGTTFLTEFNDGWQFGFVTGRRFPGNLRLESEYSIRHSTNDTLSEGMFVGPDFVPTMVYDAVDSVYSLHSMKNLLYDFNGLGGRTIPYVGVGLGGMYVNGDIITPALGRVDFINDFAFAYQLIVGTTRRFNNWTEGYVEYRYFGTNGVDINTAPGVPYDDPEFDFQSNNVIFGFRLTTRNR